MALNGSFRVSTALTNTKSGVDLSTPTERVELSKGKTISTGVLYHDSVALSASQISTLDFGDNSLSDVYGQTIAMSGITGFYAIAAGTNTSDITLSGGVNAFLSDSPALGANEGFAILANIDITTNSKLYIVNGVTSGSIDIVVAGDE